MPNTELPEERSLVYVELIGKGSYGEVWSAKWNDRLVATKRIDDKYFKADYQQEIKNQKIEELKREWQVLQNLIHPNILRMYTVLFPLNKSPVIITELLHCDLRSYIDQSTTTPKVLPHKVSSIALGVAEGLEYLHSLDIVHRDLATKNILLTTDDHPKIADLGGAKLFMAGKDEYATSSPGTPVYSAPETLGDAFYSVKYGIKVDIFSFGVVLMVLINGREPRVPQQTPSKAKGGKVTQREKRKKDIDQMGDHVLKELVLDCLHDKSSKRPAAKKIIQKLHKSQQHLTDNNGQSDANAGKSSVPIITENGAGKPQECSFEKVPSQQHYDYKFKVLLIGSTGVGKTCLLQKLRNPEYEHIYSLPTLGCDPWKEAFRYHSKYVELQITDTAGQEQFFSIQPLYFRNIQGMFLVYDVLSEETFQRLDFWIDFAKRYFSEKCVHIVLVGNKIDCIKASKKVKRVITKQQGQEYADKHGYPYVETSVIDEHVHTVMGMYEQMVEILVQTADLENVHVAIEATGKDTIKLKDTVQSKSKCPCSKSS